ncbi:hypothetical protein [Candidatus Poriferisodalis multihospitum]|uniref:hypothetical protein n=1 Tax=Candidatus Poriferisodalis multihospitum TaxID=2983191 RepID=UPI002388B375|nr:hypothetical protein [Candidatus Poriferisodalis multihospitum]MDE0318716.1 hypothetical protein [Acidimicrobiaceae bacterium]
MPVLRWSDPLTGRPTRILVAGAVAAGKSTLARQIGAAWGLPYVEMDSLYHGPAWEPRPTFRDEVIT